ncbi:hypothetical protein ACFRFL_42895 [Streptomyces sp. NPDC056708]|uniref:hypothetical protein n=1 Tax=unclassified Streptomyces TaxID=2593676 RepID=UPI00369E079F
MPAALSTTAVLDHLFRVAAEPPVTLGNEPVRYYELAAADASAPPAEFGAELEDVANSMLRDSVTGADRLTVLAELDRLPVGVREEWSRLLPGTLEDVAQIPQGHVKWRSRPREFDQL